MAVMRSVGVRLRLWNSDYNREARQSARATEEISVASRKAKTDLDAMGRSMDTVGEKAERMARRVRGSGGAQFGIRPAAPQLIVAGTAAAAALAPMIGAMIAGAVTGAVGIFAASRDPRVRSAARELKATLEEEFFGGVGALFARPVVEGIGIVEDALERLDLAEVFEPLVDDVEPLARGIAGFATSLGKGLRDAFEVAGPIIDVLAERLPELDRRRDRDDGRVRRRGRGSRNVAAPARDDCPRDGRSCDDTVELLRRVRRPRPRRT